MLPARFFRHKGRGAAIMQNLINQVLDEELLRWMLIDPSYQDELEPEDYQRIIASAMDIGQYKFDLNYLLKSDKRPPDVTFRDGSLFPQDAYFGQLHEYWPAVSSCAKQFVK